MQRQVTVQQQVFDDVAAMRGGDPPPFQKKSKNHHLFIEGKYSSLVQSDVFIVCIISLRFRILRHSYTTC